MIYSSIGIITIIINLIINHDILWKDRSSLQGVRRAYGMFIYAMLAYLVTDALWGIIDAAGSQIFLYIDTILYYIAMYLAVMLWARYTVEYLNDQGAFGKILLAVVNILAVLEIVALVVNHFVHFFFWVDEAGNYHAYTFRYIALAIQIILFITTSVYAFRMKKKAGSAAERNRFTAIGYFGIAMSGAIIIQVFYPLLPLYSVGYMIGSSLIHTFVIEDENSELRRKADEANKAKTSFLFNMSHDIRTPMNAILGFTDIGMRHTDNTAVVSDSFTKIKAAGGHLLGLINDILEMSRIESGNLVLAENPTDVREIISGVDIMGGSLATGKSIDFSTEVKNITEPYVLSDELHLNEVIINLVSNAVKYTKNGGKVKFLAQQLGEKQDGKVTYRFEVADTGIGMSQEFQEHLFEAFSREVSSTVSKTEGAGLGLSIVKRIVDIAGGTISVKSTLGEGSVFTVEWPFLVMNEEEAAEFARSKEESVHYEDSEKFEGRKILLVDDNELNREIAVDILSEEGLDIETAGDGEEAVNLVKKNGAEYYDCILMDIQMPIMDGYKATAAIRALPDGEKIPIIALSANAFEEDKKKSLEAGMNAHVAKPIDMKPLFETMHDLMK